MTVLQICAFGAPSPGNFISSLTSLEPTLSEEGIQTILRLLQRLQKVGLGVKNSASEQRFISCQCLMPEYCQRRIKQFARFIRKIKLISYIATLNCTISPRQQWHQRTQRSFGTCTTQLGIISQLKSRAESWPNYSTASSAEGPHCFQFHQNMQSMQQSWDLTVSISTMFLMGSTPHESRLLSANQSLTTS